MAASPDPSEWPAMTVSGGCACCGGALCCPDGDPAGDLCITFGSGDVNVDFFNDGGASCSPWDVSYPGPTTLAVWFDGQSFTLSRAFGGCSWGYSELVTILGNLHERSVQAELLNDAGTYRWHVVVQQVSNTTPAYTHHFRTGAWAFNGSCGDADPAAPGAATCLPVSYGEMYGDYSNGTGGRASWDGGFTLSDGTCGGALMAAAVEPPPCRFQGADLTGEERSSLRLDHRKRWLRCDKPGFERFGLPVTDCRACGTRASRRCGSGRCPGYEPAEQTADNSG